MGLQGFSFSIHVFFMLQWLLTETAIHCSNARADPQYIPFLQELNVAMHLMTSGKTKEGPLWLLAKVASKVTSKVTLFMTQGRAEGGARKRSRLERGSASKEVAH